MQVTVINNTSSSQMLEDGTILGAAYTPEAKKSGVTLSERDQRRLVGPGLISIVETPPAQVEKHGHRTAPPKSTASLREDSTQDIASKPRADK